jgi:metal-dependent amidase/aminoacylase/carboxypeptidase family protein
VIPLIAQFRETKTLGLRERGIRTQFARRYTDEDVALLAELDRLHETLSGATTRSRRRGAMVACGISPRHA